MFDGSVKNVEDVVVGDMLMGDDSTPRNVLALYRGQERLYRFTFVDGVSHVYNESHILCLVCTQTHWSQRAGEKIEITVRDYLGWSKRKQRTHAVYRTGVEFDQSVNQLLIPPIFLAYG